MKEKLEVKKWVVDFVVLIETMDREIKNLYKKAIELKRIELKKGQEFCEAEQQVKSLECKCVAMRKLNAYSNARENLIRFLKSEYEPKSKEIELSIGFMLKHSNRLLKLHSKYENKLIVHNVKNKRKRFRNESTGIKNS